MKGILPILITVTSTEFGWKFRNIINLSSRAKLYLFYNNVSPFLFQLALFFIAMMLIEMKIDETVNDSYTFYDYMGHAEYCWKQYQTHKDEYFRM